MPAALLGRVSSLDWLISIGLLPVSFALTGPVSAAIGAQTTLVAAGVLGAVVTFAALLLPGMRAVEGLGEAGEELERARPTAARAAARRGVAGGGARRPCRGRLAPAAANDGTSRETGRPGAVPERHRRVVRGRGDATT